MKRFIVLFASLGWFGAAAVAAPIVSVDNPVYSVTVQSGSHVTHSFALTNAGDETLTITNVRTSCGCTTAGLAKRDLAPGETVSLDATVNTAGFHGTVTRTISVSSNDPASPTVLRIDITIADVAPVVPEISAGDLKLVYFVLIDVRTAQEYAAGHLFGAINLPFAELQTSLAAWLPRLPREVPIIVCGGEGADGREAGALLVGAGLSNVFNLTGGIAAWIEQFGEEGLLAP